MTVDAEQRLLAPKALDTIVAADVVTIPQDLQFARMLETGTFGLGALARRTRVAARCLAVAVLDHLR